jgi:hypothetical protein
MLSRPCFLRIAKSHPISERTRAAPNVTTEAAEKS